MKRDLMKEPAVGRCAKIVMHGLGKVFERAGAAAATAALADVSLEIGDGEFVCDRRAERLRQDHAAAHRRRAGDRAAAAIAQIAPAGRRPAAERHGVPGTRPVSLDDGPSTTPRSGWRCAASARRERRGACTPILDMVGLDAVRGAAIRTSSPAA